MAEARNLCLREDREMAIAVEKDFSVLSVGQGRPDVNGDPVLNFKIGPSNLAKIQYNIIIYYIAMIKNFMDLTIGCITYLFQR
jgi:hypothetical protein